MRRPSLSHAVLYCRKGRYFKLVVFFLLRRRDQLQDSFAKFHNRARLPPFTQALRCHPEETIIMTSVLCYGDVIKLSAKSAHVDGEAGCVGFVEYKGNHQLLVVPPVKDILKDNFVEAEFIMCVQVFFRYTLNDLTDIAL